MKHLPITLSYMEIKSKVRDHGKEHKNDSTLKIHKSKNNQIKKADIHLIAKIPEKFDFSRAGETNSAREKHLNTLQ